MANYNDYQLEDAEDAAVRKSKNLKRGIVAGAAVAGVAGVGTASAYGASRLAESAHEANNELTEEDLLSGAEAGVAEAEDTTESVHTHHHHHTVVKENHVHIHPDTDQTVNDPIPPEPIDPELQVEETAVIFDENGQIVTTYDAGTYDGKAFMVMDTDGNGKGDIMAYDENANGVFEENEISYLDNETYEIGQGQNLAIYEQDSNGNVNLVQVQENPLLDPMAHVDDRGGDNIDEIHNDFLDEKSGEVYGRDLAENNPDYNNHDDAQQYTAHMDAPEVQETYTAHEEVSYEEPAPEYHAEAEVTDYGYQDPSNDMASFDSSSDSIDDSTFYDA